MRAARLLGFVYAQHPSDKNNWSSAEQRLDDQRLGALRDALGADAVADLMAQGAMLTEEQAVAEAVEL
jgi:hypothetical protein